MQKASATPHKLLIVCGPTATGKTKLAVAFARRFNGELVNADSRQVYRGLDILTGKDRKDARGVQVWLYDVVSVGEEFSISQYRKRAIHAVDEIISRGKLPILVGGTGLYIRSVIDPPETIDIPPDMQNRPRWNTLKVGELQHELFVLDAQRFNQMNSSDRDNPRRLIRQLEIARWYKEHDTKPVQTALFDCLWIGVRRDADAIKKRIIKRVSDRWKNGALDEVKRHPMAVALGSKAILSYINGATTLAEAQAQWVREEVSYAKRQMTWFKKNQLIHWYDADDPKSSAIVEKDVLGWYTRVR